MDRTVVVSFALFFSYSLILTSCGTDYQIKKRGASRYKDTSASSKTSSDPIEDESQDPVTSPSPTPVATPTPFPSPSPSPSGLPSPSPTPNPNPSPSPTPVTAAVGKTAYMNKCAGCHSLGNFDATRGRGPDLLNKSNLIASKFPTPGQKGVGNHTGVTLSQAEIDGLKLFLANPQ